MPSCIGTGPRPTANIQANVVRGQGYRTDAADGGIFTSGTMQFHGSTGSVHHPEAPACNTMRPCASRCDCAGRSMTDIGLDVGSPTGLLRFLTADRPQPDRNGDPPDQAQLDAILRAAVTVPDHGGLRPWRFVVIQGPGRDRFGDALVAGLEVERGVELPDVVTAKMRGKAFAAPCQVMIVSSPQLPSNVPEWEQISSASCTGYAMVLAALALGLGAIWKSAAVLHTEPVRSLFLAGSHEQLLGWVNLGSHQADPSTSPRSRRPLELDSVVSRLDDGDADPFGGA